MLLGRAGVVPAWSRFIHYGGNELVGPASDGASLTAQIQQLPGGCELQNIWGFGCFKELLNYKQ